MKLRQRISDDLKKYDLPTPSYPGKDRDLLELLDKITSMGDKELSDYLVKLTAFWGYYSYQAVQKKHEITELEYEFDKGLYKELETVDAKIYKTINERKFKAMQQNIRLEELYEETLLQQEKHRDLEALEKVFDKTLYTVGREISRRKEIVKAREFNGVS